MAVFSTNSLDYRSLRLGERVRQQRQAKNLTLKELAARLGISLATLSAIENDKQTLDIERLVAISNALEVAPESLFPVGKTRHYEISRRDSLEARPAAPLKLVEPHTGAITRYHNLLRPMAPAFIGKHLEPFFIQVEPVAPAASQFISHHHEEFFLVLRGEVECLLKTPDGVEQHKLGPGDCAYFWSYLPHCIRSTGRHSAECVHLLCSAHGTSASEYGDGNTGTVFFQDMSHKSLNEQIVGKIKSLRQATGMSAGEFAQNVGIGVRQLKDLEHGKKPIGLDLLLRISEHFRKPLEYFLASTRVDRPFSYVLRANELRNVSVQKRRDDSQERDPLATFRPLASGFDHRAMLPYYVKLRSSTGGTPHLHAHHGQEFVYVLNGEILLHTVDGSERTVERLSTGDCCFLDSAVPHRFEGVSLSPYAHSEAEVMMVFWCPLGESYLFEPLPKGCDVDTEAGTQ